MQQAIANITQPIFGEVEPRIIHIVEGLSVDISKISHMCTNLRIENGQCFADIKILGTPQGLILHTILTVDIKDRFGFRSRGSGIVDDNGVISDYQIVATDYIKDPA